MGDDSEQDEPEIGSSPALISDPELAFEARKALIWTGIAGLAVVCVLMARPLLVVFAGLVFGAMIDGGARLLGRVLKIGRTWRIAIVIVLAVAFVIGTVMYAGTQIAREAAELPRIVDEQAQVMVAWAQRNGFAVDESSLASVGGQLVSGVGTLTRALTGIVGGITSLILIGILGIYFALEPRLYERGVAWILPTDRREDFYVTTSRMGRQLRHLLAGRVFGMVFEGFFTGLFLAIYGVPMAALLGLITGMLAFIPNIGAPISGAIMIMVGFTGGTDMGIFTIIVYIGVQTVDGNILVPLIAKRTVDLAPALVLAMQLIMGVLFGVLGFALADPLLAMIKVALERRSEQHDAAAAALREAVVASSTGA